MKLDKEKIYKLSPLFGLIILIVILSLLSNEFLTVDNIFNILRQVAINAILAFGMTFVILTGGIDLSVGSIVALSGAVTAGLMVNGSSTVVSILIGIISGFAMGLFNGLLISLGKVPPFIATLASMTIFRGLTLVYTGGVPISKLNESFSFVGKGYVLRFIPMPVIIMLFVFLVLYVILSKTSFGKHVYAVGGNESTAFLSGVNVKKTILLVYILSGILAAISGIVLTSRLNSAQASAGVGFESDAIASVVVGGTSLSGGKGWIIGTIVGAAIIGVLTNGMNLLGVHAYYQQIVKGVVILASVLIDRSK